MLTKALSHRSIQSLRKFIIILVLAILLFSMRSPVTMASSIPAPQIPFTGQEKDPRVEIFLAEPRCGNFVKIQAGFIIQGFGPYLKGAEQVREPIPGSITLTNSSGRLSLPSYDSVVDAFILGEHLWVLTYTGLEKWHLKTESRVAEFPLPNGPSLQRKQHAQQMAFWKNTFVIAQGRKGLSQFDISSGRWLRNQTHLVGSPGLESMAVGIEIKDDEALILMDNFHLVPNSGRHAFRGLVRFNLPRWVVLRTLSGLDPGAAWISSQGSKTLIGFVTRPIWSYSSVELLYRSQLPEPDNRVWIYPENGSPVGRPWVEEKKIFTCFNLSPRFRGDNGGFARRVPRVFNRTELML